MTNYDIVKKLIGQVRPVGETNTDNERFENLKEMTELVEQLLEEIKEVAKEKTRHEFSMKRAGEFADKFLNGLNEEGKIEFAKIHVKAALETAAENAYTKDGHEMVVGGWEETKVVDKDSILSAYPDSFIK